MQLVEPDIPDNRRRKPKRPPPPIFFAEPVTPSNSFVGTEEYIAPVSQITLLNFSCLKLKFATRVTLECAQQSS